MDRLAVEKTKKVLVWVISSGAATVFLMGLATVIASYRDGEVDLQYVGLTTVILALNGLVNVVSYYLRQSGTGEE